MNWSMPRKAERKYEISFVRADRFRMDGIYLVQVHCYVFRKHHGKT